MSELFNIHMASDLSEWSSTVTDSGDLSQAAGAGLGGTTGGMSLFIDDTVIIYAQKTVTTDSSGLLRFRFYLDPNGLANAGNFQFTIVRAYNSSNGALIDVSFGKSSGVYFVMIVGRNDDDSLQYTTPSSYNITDDPHYIEVYLVRASTVDANDGAMYLYVDGTQRASKTNLDNNTQFANFSYIRFGAGIADAIEAGTSGTFYIDEIELNNDGSEIGPLGPSASLSPSASASPSTSLSPSVSESPSLSPSSSESPSLSPSASASPSGAPPIEGSVCWGHVTGVTETNVRTFATNWTGTGTIESSGDTERLVLNAGERMESEVVYTGIKTIVLLINNYANGDNVALSYRHETTEEECRAQMFGDYTVPFQSLGYVQVRVDSTL